MHLTKGTFWCLPDDYEIPKNEPSLQDIRLALHPTFTPQQAVQLDSNQELARDLFGRRYLPGYIGLNNLNCTDYLNAVVQALGHVRPLRDFFLLASAAAAGNASAGNANRVVAANVGGRNENGKRKIAASASIQTKSPTSYEDWSPLAKSFSLLLRNLWSSHRFKSHVDPHMLVQAVSVAANKRYHVGKQAEAGEFLAWLLHQLHVGVGGTVGKKPSKKKKKKGKSGALGGGGPSSVIHETFMGRVEMTTVVRKRRRRGEKAASEMLNQGGFAAAQRQPTTADTLDDEDDRDGSDDEETIERKRKKRETIQTLANETIVVDEETVTETDFLQLTLDIPEKPLFKDDDGGLVIPQEPLVNVLRKFDGVSFSDVLAMQQNQQSTNGSEGGTIVSKKRRYKLKKLPNYLILHLSRFKKNGFFIEKNPTIVMFPVKNFDLSSYVFPEGGREKVPSVEEVKDMSVSAHLTFTLICVLSVLILESGTDIAHILSSHFSTVLA